LSLASYDKLLVGKIIHVQTVFCEQMSSKKISTRIQNEIAYKTFISNFFDSEN